MSWILTSNTPQRLKISQTLKCKPMNHHHPNKSLAKKMTSQNIIRGTSSCPTLHFQWQLLQKFRNFKHPRNCLQSSLKSIKNRQWNSNFFFLFNKRHFFLKTVRRSGSKIFCDCRKIPHSNKTCTHGGFETLWNLRNFNINKLGLKNFFVISRDDSEQRQWESLRCRQTWTLSRQRKQLRIKNDKKFIKASSRECEGAAMNAARLFVVIN